MAGKPPIRVTENITIENAEILFRNFAGKASDYNQAGNRNFCVVIPANIAPQLEQDGWNIRVLEPREEGDDPKFYMPVKVSFNNVPPKIVQVTSRGQTPLNESNISVLDWAEIKHVDIVIRPYNWEVSGKHGVKAYVRTMYVTIQEDEFYDKYNNVPLEPPVDEY
jgi:hypothetical protein